MPPASLLTIVSLFSACVATVAVEVADDGSVDADVIIIGLGPVGSFMANLLPAYGIQRVLAFEKKPEVFWAPRAVTWDDYTIRSGLLVSDELDTWMRWHALTLAEQWEAKHYGLKDGSPKALGGLHRGVFSYSYEMTETWRNTNLLSSRPPGVAFHQPSWERMLRRSFANASGLQAHFGQEVKTTANVDGTCRVTVQSALSKGSSAGEAPAKERTYRARFCIAADGASSPTRQQLGLRYSGSTYPDEPWLVVDTQVEDEEYLKESWIGQEATGFVVNPSCPFTFVVTPAFFEQWWAEASAEAAAKVEARGGSVDEFAAARVEALRQKAAPYMRPPLGSQHNASVAGKAATLYPAGTAFRFEFLLPDNMTHEQAASQENVDAMLRTCAEVDPARLAIQRKAVYSFSAKRAERWRVGSVILAGDAAHEMPPFQGRGMNSGIRDVMNLAWKLRLILQGHADEAILDSYEMERRVDLEQQTEASIKLGETVMERNLAAAYFRDFCFILLTALQDRFPSWATTIQPYLIAKEPDVISAQSLIATGQGQDLAGQLMPCPRVRVGSGDVAKDVFLDQVVGTRTFSLVWCEAGTAESSPLAASPESLEILRKLGTVAVSVVSFRPEANTAAVAEAAQPIVAGLAAGTVCADAEGHWTSWVQSHSLEGRLIVLRPDRFIFGIFRDVDAAAQQLSKIFHGPSASLSQASVEAKRHCWRVGK